ncbi:ankyrin repeat-containing protein [Acrasis kona]|uniref:Ankyrin repeat-containing protein n=1 Tax=Acrasis kona TaxID=1008807 RepID=A0AAW2ZC48_9EUKA
MSPITEQLLNACLSNNYQFANDLLQNSPPSTYDINALKIDEGGCCLHYAIMHQNPELVRLLLRYGANPAVQSLEGGSNALHLAAHTGNHTVLQLILNAPTTSDSLIDSIDQEHYTPLMFAVASRSVYCITELLKRKCDVHTIESKSKRTALHICCMDKCLREDGMDDEDAIGAQIEISRLLLNYGSDPNKKDDNGQTPLHLAVMTLSQKVCSTLLNFNGLIDIRDNSGKTARDIAIEMNNQPLATFLENKRASVLHGYNTIQANLQPLLRENESLHEKVKKLESEVDELRNLLTSNKFREMVMSIVKNN